MAEDDLIKQGHVNRWGEEAGGLTWRNGQGRIDTMSSAEQWRYEIRGSHIHDNRTHLPLSIFEAADRLNAAHNAPDAETLRGRWPRPQRRAVITLC